MSSESELTEDSCVSSEPDRIQSPDKNLKAKRKRGTKIVGSSSDTSSSTEIPVKKARAYKDVTCANNRKNSNGTESSSEDGFAKEKAVSISHEPTEIKSVRDVSKVGRTVVQRRCSDIVTDSFCGDVKASSDRLTSSKSKNDTPDSVGDSNSLHTDSDSSVSVKFLNKSDLPSTGPSGEECADKPKPLHSRKKKISKENIARKQVQNDSSDDECSDSSRCPSERNKPGKKSKLEKQIRKDSSAKGNTDKSLANKMEANELKTKKQRCVKKEIHPKTGASNKVEVVSGPEKLVQQNKEQEKIQSEIGSELSESGGSKSSSKSDLKMNKNSGKPKNRAVGSNRQVNKLSKKTFNKSSKVTSEQNSCETSTDSDSGLEGSDNEMKCKMPAKVKTDEMLKSKVQHKESVSSSGSDSEPLIRTQDDKFPVGKTVPSDSGSDSESDKQRQNLKSSLHSRSSSSDDKEKTKDAHTVSSSDSDSEAELIATKKKEVKGTENLKNKPVKNVGEKNIGKSVQDLHRDKAVMRAKRYAKEAGLRIQNYASLWAGCRSNKARAQAIIGFLHENGLSGTPTLEKCKRLRIKREKKNEASELDLGNIINTGRESRRKVTSPVRKPVEVHNPIKEEIKKRFARIQALGDSDSSSE